MSIRQDSYPLWIARVRASIAFRTDVEVSDDLAWGYYKGGRTVEEASADILEFLTDPFAPRGFSSYPLWAARVRAALSAHTELDVTDEMARTYYGDGLSVEDASANILRLLEETPGLAKPPPVWDHNPDEPAILIGPPGPRFVWEPKEDITSYELAQAMPFLFRLNEDPLAWPDNLSGLGKPVLRHFRLVSR